MNAHPEKNLAQRRPSADSGQAMVELVFVLFILVIMVFGLIDFGRFIYERQVIVNVTRESANLASRGTDFTNTVAAAMTSGYPLKLSTLGRVIVTQVTNSNGVNRITGQYSQGGISGASHVGTGIGTTAILPATVTPVPQPTQSLFVAEIFYTFTPITPIGKLMSLTLPTKVYDAAYF